jgi:hypothetical protein
MTKPSSGTVIFGLVVCVALGVAAPGPSAAAQSPPGQAGSATARQAGTVKAISGNTITLAPDSGPEVAIVVQEGARIVRVAPGQKDLKDAKPIQLTDIQPGDRILVRGVPGALANSLLANSIIAMAQSDIAAKQARERDEWQRHGVGGLVAAVDSSGSAISITTAALADKKTVAVRFSENTVLRRYAPDSVKFDDAKAAPVSAIRPGDQLRARGTRSEDGGELKADEIVSGTFRNIAGTISAVDAAAGTLTLQDLATKKAVTVKVTAESQLRKLPAPFAQRIAMRLKGIAPDAAVQGGAPPAGPPASGAAAQGARPAGAAGAGAGFGGAGRPGGAMDFQQMLSRMPAAALTDLQKGEAVMLVATEGTSSSPSTVITLLGGVEPILEASPKNAASSILSPWTLSGPAEGGATP